MSIAELYRNRGVNPLAVQKQSVRELMGYPPLWGDSSIISYWRMEGNSNDSRGANNGTDTDMAYGSAYGKFGQGASFNGSSSRIVLPSSLPDLTTFSILSWFKTSYAGAAHQYIYTQAPTADNADVSLLILASTRKAEISIWNGSAGSVADTSVAVNDGVWHNLIATRSGATLKIYLDGLLSGSIVNASTVTIGSDSGTIGRHPSGVNYMSGQLDDIALFSRVLTNLEILNYYLWATA